MKFITHNKVRIHDTDMAGLLYFARQFRFAIDALEDFVASEGYSFERVFRELDLVFVIVHCEANYFHPIRIGDELEVHLHIEKVGKASFTICYHFYNQNKVLVGNAKTVHVTLSNTERKKIPIPDLFASCLKKYSE